MNNKKLFNYINQHGGNSNNIIKINNLDSMIDFESSDVIDNTEDYTSSLLSKILSNGINDNDVLSDSSGGVAFMLAKIANMAINNKDNIIKYGKKIVDNTDVLNNNVNVRTVKKSKEKQLKNTEVKAQQKKQKKQLKKVEDERKAQKPRAINEKKQKEVKTKKNNLNFDELLGQLNALKKTISENMNDDLQNLNVDDKELDLNDMLSKLEIMKKELSA